MSNARLDKAHADLARRRRVAREFVDENIGLLRRLPFDGHAGHIDVVEALQAFVKDVEARAVRRDRRMGAR